MAKNGTVAMQLKNAGNVDQALAVLLQASATDRAEATKITKLVQRPQETNDTDEDTAAPAVAACESLHDGIIDGVSDMLEG